MEAPDAAASFIPGSARASGRLPCLTLSSDRARGLRPLLILSSDRVSGRVSKTRPEPVEGACPELAEGDGCTAFGPPVSRSEPPAP